MYCLRQRNVRRKVSVRTMGGLDLCRFSSFLETALMVVYLCLFFNSNTDSNFMVILLLLLKGKI